MAEGKKIGRPTKMTPEVIEALRQAFLIGATNEEAYRFAGVSHETFYNYIEKHPEFREDMETWKQAPILKAKKTVANDLSMVKTAQWYLERRAKKDYGANVDLTSDGDKLTPLLVKFIGEDGTEEGS
jgi:hypothetical protein